MAAQVVLIQRSDIHRVCRVTKEGKRYTALEVMQDFPTNYMRADIALINLSEHDCPSCKCMPRDYGRQALVFAGYQGEPVGDGVQYLNAEELAWCKAEGQKLLALVDEYPEVANYLRGR